MPSSSETAHFCFIYCQAILIGFRDIPQNLSNGYTNVLNSTGVLGQHLGQGTIN